MFHNFPIMSSFILLIWVIIRNHKSLLVPIFRPARPYLRTAKIYFFFLITFSIRDVPMIFMQFILLPKHVLLSMLPALIPFQLNNIFLKKKQQKTKQNTKKKNKKKKQKKTIKSYA